MGVYSIFFYPGEVVEIRVIGVQGKNAAWEGYAKNTVSGYFDDPEAFAKAAAALDKAQARGIYFTLNPDLLARAQTGSRRRKAPRRTRVGVGTDRQGMVRSGRQGLDWLGTAWRGRKGSARLGLAGVAWQGPARTGMAGQGLEWQAWHGPARQGSVWRGLVGRGRNGRKGLSWE